MACTNSMLIGVYTAFVTHSAFFSGLNNAIFRAPMLFFDSTLIGRILTCASSNLSILDSDIFFALVSVAASATESMATIGLFLTNLLFG
ncbi:hypothetical protein V6N13_013932 [Hibiscus sabdariffa]